MILYLYKINLCRTKPENIIDVGFAPKTSNLTSYLYFMVSELEDLAINGMLVYSNNNQYFLKVHLLGSLGDIPSVSEINFLTGHTSYWACRCCTFRSDRESNRMCFGTPTNEPFDMPRIRTIDELKNGDSLHGVKKPSLFRNLPSFINVYFFGIDEFHMFGLNISNRLRDLFVGTVGSAKTILHLQKKNVDLIGDNVAEEGKKIPSIFEGEFKDILRNSSKVRGVDYLVFLKYVVPTFVIEQLKYQLEQENTEDDDIKETIEALESISLICSIINQYTISEKELEILENHINIWLDFYKKYIPKEQYNINIHYLTHIVDIIKIMGPLRQISCRSMERRIQRMKRKINSTSNAEKNVENIFIDEAYRNYNARCITSSSNNNNNMMSGNFKYSSSFNNYSLYGLKSRLLHLWNIPPTENLNDE